MPKGSETTIKECHDCGQSGKLITRIFGPMRNSGDSSSFRTEPEIPVSLKGDYKDLTPERDICRCVEEGFLD